MGLQPELSAWLAANPKVRSQSEVHTKVHSSARRTATALTNNLCVLAHATVTCIQSDCYTRPDSTIVSKMYEAGLRRSDNGRWDIYVCSPLGVRSQVRL